jgi:hypothetical protein
VGNPAVGIPEDLVAGLRDADTVAVLTGSGISAESGVPTFRDAQTGLWARYDPMQLATPEAFGRDPDLVWEWYSWRRELVEKAMPNPGHEALADLERYVTSFSLLTQNVDGLHRRAGSRNVVELHGNILRSKCSREGVVVEPRADDTEVPPSCPRCGAPLRPDLIRRHVRARAACGLATLRGAPSRGRGRRGQPGRDAANAACPLHPTRLGEQGAAGTRRLHPISLGVEKDPSPAS